MILDRRSDVEALQCRPEYSFERVLRALVVGGVFVTAAIAWAVVLVSR